MAVKKSQSIPTPQKLVHRFPANGYDWPAWASNKKRLEPKPERVIDIEELKDKIFHGSDWNLLEELYMINRNDLEREFNEVYRQAVAEAKAKLWRTMYEQSFKGNTTMIKWVTANVLGMSEKSHTTSDTKTLPLSAEEIDAQLSSLFDKYKDKLKEQNPFQKLQELPFKF